MKKQTLFSISTKNLMNQQMSTTISAWLENSWVVDLFPMMLSRRHSNSLGTWSMILLSTLLLKISSSSSSSLIDRNWILHYGPWTFDKNLLILKWSEITFKPSEMNFNKTAFWVHLLDFPLAFRTKSLAASVGNVIGKFIDVDCLENENCRGPNLRIRIEIDIRTFKAGYYD